MQKVCPHLANWVLVATGCLLGSGTGLEGQSSPRPVVTGELFREEAQESGLDFVHQNGMTGQLYFAEMMGAGAALFDLEGDGDLDIFLPQGHLLSRETLAKPPRDRLYRNDLEVTEEGQRKARFVDVTEKAGLPTGGYGMGVATGDYDNDGLTDLYVTNYEENRLLRNRGDGTFEDVTDQAGAGERRWSVSATFLDYDRDGWLDLYIGNYAASTLVNHVVCHNITGEADYCGPQAYPPEHDRLLRNRGRAADGRVTFEDVSATALKERQKSTTLGVVSADFNGDDWLDIYVANDLMPNHLWLHQGDGAFVDEAQLGGCAISGEGLLEASMGVVADDLDGDGDVDLFMTHLNQQTNTLYANDGQAFFQDATLKSGIGTPSWSYTGFGTLAFDYDNDGDLDLLVVNGAVKHKQELLRQRDPFPLHEPNQLFRNRGDGSFEEVTDRAGAAFKLSEVSRGAASGDIDNDGDLDVLISNNNGQARLLINQVGNERPWLGLRLLERYERDALGARVILELDGAPAIKRRVATDGSYGSASDPRLLIGLGQGTKLSRLRVHWPDGQQERFNPPPLGSYTTLRQGSGESGNEKPPTEASSEEP